ncbi:Protein of unknown function [Streptococcus thermophilus]|nr:Protein of unknown function [Streptococcus thermophilus]
MLVILVQMV